MNSSIQGKAAIEISQLRLDYEFLILLRRDQGVPEHVVLDVDVIDVEAAEEPDGVVLVDLDRVEVDLTLLGAVDVDLDQTLAVAGGDAEPLHRVDGLLEVLAGLLLDLDGLVLVVHDVTPFKLYDRMIRLRCLVDLERAADGGDHKLLRRLGASLLEGGGVDALADDLLPDDLVLAKDALIDVPLGHLRLELILRVHNHGLELGLHALELLQVGDLLLHHFEIHHNSNPPLHEM